MRGLSFLSLPRVAGGEAARLAEGAAWATVGVLTDKGVTRETANGRNYARWTLADLSGTSVSLFLFGDAYSDWWRADVGAVMAVLRPKLSPRGGSAENDKHSAASISVDGPAQLLKLGTCPDLGTCRGTRRDGTRCTMPVNASNPAAAYCCFHAGAALRVQHASKQQALPHRPGGGGAKKPPPPPPRLELNPSRRLAAALAPPRPPLAAPRPPPTRAEALAAQQRRYVSTDALRRMAMSGTGAAGGADSGAAGGGRRPTHGQRVLMSLVRAAAAAAEGGERAYGPPPLVELTNQHNDK